MESRRGALPIYEESSREEPDLRLHWSAATGSGMVIRVQECNSGIHPRFARDHATNQQVWRGLSVQQSDGGGCGIHWRTPGVSETGARGRLRQGDAAEDFRSPGDEEIGRA